MTASVDGASVSNESGRGRGRDDTNQYAAEGTAETGEGGGGGSFSPLVAACFALNYIVGTGFLALPWAFYRAGWALSAIVLIGVCVAANIGSDYILSAMARAEALDNCDGSSSGGGGGGGGASLFGAADNREGPMGKGGGDQGGGSDGEGNGGLIELGECEGGGEEMSALLNEREGRTPYGAATLSVDAEEGTGSGGGGVGTLTEKSTVAMEAEAAAAASDGAATAAVANDVRLAVGPGRGRDVPELCRLFLGPWGFRGYAFCVSYYLYGALWSFTSVFGSAVGLVLQSSSIGGKKGEDKGAEGEREWADPYALGVLLFSLVVVPMSFLDLDEQKILQLILSGGRILVIALMILTPVVATISSTLNGEGKGGDAMSMNPHFDNQARPMGAPLASPSGIHQMMPVLVYAAIFHFSIPSLSSTVSDKSRLGDVFGLTFLLCGALYTSIGIVDACYFGYGVEQSANLNWGSYHGGTGRWVPYAEAEATAVGEDGRWMDAAIWARGVSSFVVMFPALNVISAFPLHAFSLGNSLMEIYFGDRINEVESNRRIKSAFRAVACIPPLVGGLFIRDLGTITDYAGLAGLAIAFCFPAMLYLGSERTMTTMTTNTLPHLGHARTRYERWGSSSKEGAAVVLVFGASAILWVFVTLALAE